MGSDSDALRAEAVTLYDNTDGSILLTVAHKDMSITLSLSAKLAKRLSKLLAKKTTRSIQFDGSMHILLSEPLKKDVIKNLDSIIKSVDGLTN